VYFFFPIGPAIVIKTVEINSVLLKFASGKEYMEFLVPIAWDGHATIEAEIIDHSKICELSDEMM
jgi:hypothetical protein